MSWSQRLSQFSGRWSPFTRSPTTDNGAQVNDGDFSYITAEDLKNGAYDRCSDGPPRDTDVIKLKDKRGTSYSIHFPAYSIDRGELTIGNVREKAAEKLGVDQQRIRLLYRGKKLGDNARTCREEGLREGADVMCATSDADAAEVAAAGHSSGESDDDNDEQGETTSGQPKRKRVRHKNKKKKGGKKKVGEATDSDLPASGTASPKPPPIPKTPLEKLNAAGQTLASLSAQCQEFKVHPPEEAAKRDFEHKRLSETILTQVLLKLDAVETDDPEARARRKELVREAQQVLNDLDAAKGT